MQLQPTQTAPAELQPSHGSGVVNTIMALTRRHSLTPANSSSAGGRQAPLTHFSTSSSTGARHLPLAHFSTSSAPPTVDGAAAGLAAAGFGDGSSMAGTSTPAASSVVGVHEAVPPVEGFVPNPVLANLERAFNSDPRRHKRTDSQVSQLSQLSKLSNLSISSLTK
jgi:hypothetical protein